MEFERKEPGRVFPVPTCPDIDKAIDILQELREANSTLRDWAEYWQDLAEFYKGEISSYKEDARILNVELGLLTKKLMAGGGNAG